MVRFSRALGPRRGGVVLLGETIWLSDSRSPDFFGIGIGIAIGIETLRTTLPRMNAHISRSMSSDNKNAEVGSPWYCQPVCFLLVLRIRPLGFTRWLPGRRRKRRMTGSTHISGMPREPAGVAGRLREPKKVHKPEIVLYRDGDRQSVVGLVRRGANHPSVLGRAVPAPSS
jgi:hypothetical protein